MTPDELEAIGERFNLTGELCGQADLYINRLYASSRDVPALLAALAEAQRERDEARRLAELTAEQVAANAQIIDEERRLMRPVVEAAREHARVLRLVAELQDGGISRQVRALVAAVDTYETQTGGTE